MPVHSFPITTTGAAGSATGTTTTFKWPPGALLDAIRLVYDATAPGSTDVTIAEATGLGRTVLALTNNATSGVYYPRHGTHDNAGTAGSGEEHFLLEGALTITVAQSNALSPAVTIHVQTIQNLAAQ